MKFVSTLFLTLLVGCERPLQGRAVTAFLLVQPEWGGLSGTAPVDPLPLKFYQTVSATVTSPLYARRVRRSRPMLDASVSQVVARMLGTVRIGLVVTADDRGAALAASQTLVDAMLKLTSEESDKKHGVRLRLLDRPTIIAGR